MGLWDKIFSNKIEVQRPEGDFEANFGRFSDAIKTTVQQEAWDKSVIHFENRDYQPAMEEFIHYIENNDRNNVVARQDDSGFVIYQGSKSIRVQIKNGQIAAQCQVAETNQMHIGFMRRLLDLNYELKYVKYGLSDDNIITVLFETSLEDASPYKLYFGLKELAIHADKQDDLLVHEFNFLKPIHSGKISKPSKEEANHKLHFLRSNIQESIDLIESGKLKIEQYPAAGGYILLALLYKIDYLVRPEGKLMDKMEQMHKSYFGQSQKNVLMRLKNLKEELISLGELPEEMIKANLYQSVFTFGFTSPANTSAAFEVIDKELRNIQWYLDNQFDEYVTAIVEYIGGLSLFNFALPEVMKELYTVIYRITENDFFLKVKSLETLVDHQHRPDKTAIRNELNRIERKYKPDYPELDIDIKSLQYDQVSLFLYSYILMIRQLQFQKGK